jgi:hypothetical protein
MSKVHLYLERFWLGIAILATIVTSIYAFQDGFTNTRVFWLITGISWAMFFVRRGVRKRMEKHAKTMGTKKK